MTHPKALTRLVGAALIFALGACTNAAQTGPSASLEAPVTASQNTEAQAVVRTAADFEADRAAILAMAGTYEVTFDFTETVILKDGYKLKDPKLSGAHEVVRVIEDTGTKISLQHILVVGGDQKFPVKHWRQDWVYEPEAVLTFIGGNAWEMQPVSAEERAGRWSQQVYQVDDSPRYGAVAAWTHNHGVSEWTPAAAWRPLPRRDMTTRDDYHAVSAVNRHAITPEGWVHEQDNTKLDLSGNTPQALAREVGVNTYRKADDFAFDIADTYWAETKEYWAIVRGHWDALEAAGAPFGLTVKGETADVYAPLLSLATDFSEGTTSAADAGKEAGKVIESYLAGTLAPLHARLRPRDDAATEVAR